jgi:hypothetical protein
MKCKSTRGAEYKLKGGELVLGGNDPRVTGVEQAADLGR